MRKKTISYVTASNAFNTMCLSAEASFLALVVSLTGAACVWQRGGRTDRYVAVWCVLVGMMQALELGMWLDQGCGALNQIATALVPMVLMAQAVWLVGGAYLYGVSRLPPKVLQAWLVLTAVILSTDIGVHHTTACSTAHPELGHLVWGNVMGERSLPLSWLPYSAAFGALLTLKDRAYGRAVFAAGCGTMLLVIAKRPLRMTGAWRSVWCAASSAILPATALAWSPRAVRW